jgi:hypothetical protein
MLDDCLVQEASGIPHVFFPILINRQVDGAKRASSNFILDHVLINSMFSVAVVFTIRIPRLCIQSLLDVFVVGSLSLMVSKWGMICRSRAVSCQTNLHKLPKSSAIAEARTGVESKEAVRSPCVLHPFPRICLRKGYQYVSPRMIIKCAITVRRQDPRLLVFP